MSDWFARRAEAEREWFRKEHEKQFGKPSREDADTDVDKVIERFRKQSERKVSERKYFEPTAILPPPLEPVDWTGAPLALKCVCPTGDCQCTCKGNTLLPKKRIPLVPRYNWWGLKSLYWKLPFVRYPQPVGTLAENFAEAAKVEWHFYRSEEGRKILIERGPEFCLSGCLKYFITNRKMEKNFTALITEMKANVVIEERVEEAVEQEQETIVKKKIWSDRICDQFHCTVSTQSEVDRDGEFVIGDYSHLLFGSTDENLLCDIEGAELHVAAYKDEPEDLCTFLNVSRTVDKLFHVTEIKQRISSVKKTLITSIFEIPERFNSRASQYECKDIPFELPEGICESLADVRKKRKEKECLKKRLEESILNDGNLNDINNEVTNKNNISEVVEDIPKVTSLTPFEKLIHIKDSIKSYIKPADAPFTSENLWNTPCNKGYRDFKGSKNNINSKVFLDTGDNKSLIADKKQISDGIDDSAVLLDKICKKGQRVREKSISSSLNSVDKHSNVNITNEWMPCKFELDPTKTNVKVDEPYKSTDIEYSNDITEINKSGLDVKEPKENGEIKYFGGNFMTNKDKLDAREPKKSNIIDMIRTDDNDVELIKPRESIYKKMSIKSPALEPNSENIKYFQTTKSDFSFRDMQKSNVKEWMPCKFDINADKNNLKNVKPSKHIKDQTNMKIIEPKENSDTKSVKDVTNVDITKLEVDELKLRDDIKSDKNNCNTDEPVLVVEELKKSKNTVQTDETDMEFVQVQENGVNQLTTDTPTPEPESENMQYDVPKKSNVSFKGDIRKTHINQWMPCMSEIETDKANMYDENKECVISKVSKGMIETSQTLLEESVPRESINSRSNKDIKSLETNCKNIESSLNDCSNLKFANEWYPCKSQIQSDENKVEAKVSAETQSVDNIIETDLNNFVQDDTCSDDIIKSESKTSQDIESKPKEMKYYIKRKSNVSFKDRPKYKSNEWMSCKSQIKTSQPKSEDKIIESTRYKPRENAQFVEPHEPNDADSKATRENKWVSNQQKSTLNKLITETGENNSTDKNNSNSTSTKDAKSLEASQQEFNYTNIKKSDVLFKDEQNYKVSEWMPCKSQIEISLPNLGEGVNIADITTTSSQIPLQSKVNEIKDLNINEWTPCKSQTEVDQYNLEGSACNQNGVTCVCKEDKNRCSDNSLTNTAIKNSVSKSESRKGSKFSWKMLFQSNSASKKSSINVASNKSVISCNDGVNLNCKIRCGKSVVLQKSKDNEVEVFTSDLDETDSKNSNRTKNKVISESKQQSEVEKLSEQHPNNSQKSDSTKYYKFYF